MGLFEIAQYGVAIFSIAALVYVITFVVKRFMDFLTKQEDNFHKIITNHLDTDTKAKNKLEQSNVGLTKSIDQLTHFLSNHK